MRQLLEAGVHFGHSPRRWNPKMAPFIFGTRNNVHIINLEKTVPLLKEALTTLTKIAASGGRILFVGTKHQAAAAVADCANACGQYFINHRWLGGTLTNWQTISNSINRLKKLNGLMAEPQGFEGLTKKEVLKQAREQEKLNSVLGGITEMGGVPDMVVVMDANKDALAIQECQKMGIPLVAIIDTNTNPDGITYPVPGNDDAIKAIELYCDLFSRAVLSGIQQEMVAAGVDLGTAEVTEEIIAEEEEPAACSVSV